MVNVQMRFAIVLTIKGSTINQLPAAGEAELSKAAFRAAANSAGCKDQQNDEQKFDAGRADRQLNRTTERNPAETMRRAGLEERRCFITRWCSSLSR